MRPTNMPVRGRQRQATGLEDAPCDVCGLKPGKPPTGIEGRTNNEILCRACGKEYEKQSMLVPRVCGNPACGSTKTSLLVRVRVCGACYHYKRKKQLLSHVNLSHATARLGFRPVLSAADQERRGHQDD